MSKIPFYSCTQILPSLQVLSEQIINDIEGGRRWPRRTTLSKITDALGVDVQELFAGTEFMPNSDLPSRFVEELKNSFDEILKRYNGV